jgi:hypothetical protein
VSGRREWGDSALPMPRWERWIFLGVIGWALLLQGRPGECAAEVKLGKDFLAGVVEKLPPAPFEKAGKYRGMVHSYRLLAIDPRARVFLAACQIEGEFHPPVTGPISERVGRSPQTPEGWRKFRFEVKARVNIEPSGDAAPRFRVEIDEVKRRELDGFSGLVAKFLGQYFDEIVTQIASGRASRLNQKLNAEVIKRVSLFKEYGVFRGIDYSETEVVLHFDLTRYLSEGIAGHVFAEARPGTVPLYRWLQPHQGSHFYTIRPGAPDRPNSVDEGIACHVYDRQVPEAIPLYHWSNGRDHLYTTTTNGENARRAGYHPRGIACYVYADPKPGTIPLYRFHDPTGRHHFYTTHPNAEFAK